MSKKPKEPPPKDSLAALAEFTKRILQVPKGELQDSDDSTGAKKIDACPET